MGVWGGGGTDQKKRSKFFCILVFKVGVYGLFGQRALQILFAQYPDSYLASAREKKRVKPEKPEKPAKPAKISNMKCHESKESHES